MHKVALVLACLSFTGHGRFQNKASNISNPGPLNALASILRAFHPAVAFTCVGHSIHAAVTKPVLSGPGVAVMREAGDGIIWPRPPAISRREFAAAAAALPVAGAQAMTTATKLTLPATQLTLPDSPALAQGGFKLNTGVNFPSASFGLQVYDDDEAEKLTLIALEAGFRNFFASVLAGNQRGFARAIKKSGVPREDIFICGSVLSNQRRGFDAAYQLSAIGCKENMQAFSVGGIDYIDMIMLDYPGLDEESIRGQWKALEEMKQSGLTHSLAVSNFSPQQLDVILEDKTATVPTVNQLPYGVGYGPAYGGNAAQVIEENRKRGVLVQAWSPLESLSTFRQTCAQVGKKYGKSAAQVALRWIVDTGAAFTTQTKSKAHFEEDINIFDFKLTKEEIEMLAAL